MSGRYMVHTTLTIGGVEDDYWVRGNVLVEPSRSRGSQAYLDGDAEVDVTSTEGWVDTGSLDLDARSRERIVDVLCEAALEDDSDYCANEERAS